jgi:hypothetical protein
MDGNFSRYISKVCTDRLSVEVEFLAPNFGESASINSSCSARCTQLNNPDVHNSPWIELWSLDFGNPKMPSGAWNGVKLVEIINSRVFLAISNKVLEIDTENGNAIWSKRIGNTPVYHLSKSPTLDNLIVFNGYYEFVSNNGLGNISSHSLDGKQLWQCELPSSDDIFANAPVNDGDTLKAGSWNCYSCSIDETSGKITQKQFTK